MTHMRRASLGRPEFGPVQTAAWMLNSLDDNVPPFLDLGDAVHRPRLQSTLGRVVRREPASTRTRRVDDTIAHLERCAIRTR